MSRAALRSALASVFAALALPAAATPPDVSSLALDEAVVFDTGPLARTNAPAEYVVTLTSPPLSKAYKAAGGMSKEQQRAHSAKLAAEQDVVAQRLAALGGSEVARLDKSLNAIVASLTLAQARELEQMAGVASVRPLNRYELDLTQSVAHIGAAALQASGRTGAGIRVAVLDSGIDYTHAAFGGAGTLAAYQAAYGTATTDARNKSRDGLFPTSKVIGGWDFVGDAWTGAAGSPPTAPDDDPIDCSPTAIGCGGGHGTHVADIIAGVQAGKPGVAPGALLYAVKVCSAVSTACNGVAMMQGVEFALDPDRDGDISDRVDVINLSLGASYGQDEDDISGALNNAADLGVVVVASAGNSGDKPYVVGSPSSARNVISVAQTQMPGRFLYRIVASGRTALGGWQAWSAPPTVTTGPLAYVTTSNATRRGCNPDGSSPYAPGSLTGSVALMDRGDCNISLKSANAAAAGAIAAVIANNAAQPAGDLPPDYSFGGGAQPIPAYSITLADGNLLKPVANVATATIDPANALPLTGNIVASSSRGPTMSRNSIKPDVGAPGGSISANVGTGTGNTPFSGTSGAAPMVAGAAALVMEARPSLSVSEIKSLLMNTGNTNIGINPISLPGFMAPITRIGGGEVRVDKAVASQTAAWDKDAEAASLSFGYLPLSKPATVVRKVVVRNYGAASRTYLVSTGFRYADDAATGAISLSAPPSVTVPANGKAEFEVVMSIDPSRLGTWSLNGGAQGGNGMLLASAEIDGYVTLDGGADNTVHLAWQALPHRAADVTALPREVTLKKDGTAELRLSNRSGVLNGRFEAFSLTGQSPRIHQKYLPGDGDNRAVVDLKSVGVRLANCGVPCVQFAIDTYGARAHPNYPAGFEIHIFRDADNVADAFVFNRENGTFASSGQNVVAAGPLANGTFPIRFYSDADLNSGNIILTALLSDLGITAGSTFRFSVYSYDNYFTGQYTDGIEGMTYTLDTPRYVPAAFTGAVPAGTQAALGVTAVPGGEAKSPSQSGLLLLYRDAEGKARRDVGQEEAQAVPIK